MRSVLDVSNREKYAEKNVEVVSPADIVNLNSELRRRRPSLPLSTDPFKFLYDLTKQYKRANICVDEVSWKNLIKRRKIHSKCFSGSLWLAVSSISRYDFIDQRNNSDDQRIPAARKQNFRRIRLKKNMRNGDKIVKKSFCLQRDIIEKGVTGKIPSAEKNKGINKDHNTKETNNKGEEPSTSMEPLAQRMSEGGVEAIEEIKNEDTDNIVKVRVVEGGQDAVFRSPEQEATGCRNIPGKEPKLCKGVQRRGSREVHERRTGSILQRPTNSNSWK